MKPVMTVEPDDRLMGEYAEAYGNWEGILRRELESRYGKVD